MAGPTYGPKIHLHCYTLGTGDNSHILDPRRRSGRPSASPHGRTVTGACNNPPEGVVGAGRVAIPEDAGQTHQQRSAHRDKAASKYHCTEATNNLKRGRRAQKAGSSQRTTHQTQAQARPDTEDGQGRLSDDPPGGRPTNDQQHEAARGQAQPRRRQRLSSHHPGGQQPDDRPQAKCRRGRKDRMGQQDTEDEVQACRTYSTYYYTKT